MLLQLHPAQLLSYFMKQLGDLPIADIDIRGDVDDVKLITPWSCRLRSVVRGRIRFGAKCGPDVPREGGVRYAS